MDDLDRLQPIIDATAKEASKETLRETFMMLGVDLADFKDVRRFRADLIFARRQREISERARSIAFRAVIVAIVAGAFSGIGWAVKVILTAGQGGS